MVKKYLARPAERKPPKAFRRYDITGRQLLPRNGIRTAKSYSPTAFQLTLHSNLELPRKAVSIFRGSSGANSKKTLSDLPQELLLDLAELLPVEALYNLAHTCKYIKFALHQYLYQKQGERLLHWAASAGRRGPAHRAIQYKQSIDVNYIQSGKTALAQAIAGQRWYYGDFAGITKLLLKQDCIDLTDATNGIPMLQTALENGAYSVVDRLFKEGQGKIDRIFENGQTPLMTAACNGHKDVVDLLIQCGADVNQQTSLSAGPIGTRRTALALVIQKHRPPNAGILWQQDDDLASVAKVLSEQEGIDLTDATNGIPMLKTAIEKRVIAVVDRLLEKNQDNIDTLFENGQTPLIAASRYGSRPIVDLLIRRGANVNQRTGPVKGLDLNLANVFGGDNWTALAVASRHGHEDVVHRLLECETIDTDVVAKETETPVLSWELSLDELTQELHERKPLLRQGSALFWAVVQGRPHCVLALLQSGRVLLSIEELTRLQNMAKSVIAGSDEAELRCVLWLLNKCKGIDETASPVVKLQGVTASTLQDVRLRYQLKEFFVLCEKKPRRGKSTPTAAGNPAMTQSRRRRWDMRV